MSLKFNLSCIYLILNTSEKFMKIYWISRFQVSLAQYVIKIEAIVYIRPYQPILVPNFALHTCTSQYITSSVWYDYIFSTSFPEHFKWTCYIQLDIFAYIQLNILARQPFFTPDLWHRVPGIRISVMSQKVCMIEQNNCGQIFYWHPLLRQSYSLWLALLSASLVNWC